MTGKERSSYIREALRFYYRFGGNLRAISESIKDIATKIDNVDLKPTIDMKKESKKEVGTSESEEMLIDSIQDLLSL